MVIAAQRLTLLMRQAMARVGLSSLDGQLGAVFSPQIEVEPRRSGDPNSLPRKDGRTMHRQFAGNSADSIRAIARTAYKKREIAVLRAAVLELSNFRTTSEARRLIEELAPLLGQLEEQTSAPHARDDGPEPPESWLSGVQAIARHSGTSKSTGPCCVYLVLLYGPQYPGGFGVYVGQTALTAEQRFQNHRNGHKSSKDVRECGVRLLRPFFDHLQGLFRKDAERIERELAKALAQAGYCVEGGH